MVANSQKKETIISRNCISTIFKLLNSIKEKQKKKKKRDTLESSRKYTRKWGSTFQ